MPILSLHDAEQLDVADLHGCSRSDSSSAARRNNDKDEEEGPVVTPPASRSSSPSLPGRDATTSAPFRRSSSAEGEAAASSALQQRLPPRCPRGRRASEANALDERIIESCNFEGPTRSHSDQFLQQTRSMPQPLDEERSRDDRSVDSRAIRHGFARRVVPFKSGSDGDGNANKSLMSLSPSTRELHLESEVRRLAALLSHAQAETDQLRFERDGLDARLDEEMGKRMELQKRCDELERRVVINHMDLTRGSGARRGSQALSDDCPDREGGGKGREGTETKKEKKKTAVRVKGASSSDYGLLTDLDLLDDDGSCQGDCCEEQGGEGSSNTRQEIDPCPAAEGKRFDTAFRQESYFMDALSNEQLSTKPPQRRGRRQAAGATTSSTDSENSLGTEASDSSSTARTSTTSKTATSLGTRMFLGSVLEGLKKEQTFAGIA